MTTICNFLSGCCNFTGAVDNKHNIKNDRYQIVGGSGVPLVEMLTWYGRQVFQKICGLWRTSLLTKRLRIFFCIVLWRRLRKQWLKDGQLGWLRTVEYLLSPCFFLRLHLHAMNARLEVSHCRAMYLWMSMIFFTSLTGVNITPKRNMVSETISNMFIVMRSDVCNPCYCTSEPAEHGFGNTRRSQREFTCSDFASHVEKENCCMQTMFEGGLSPSHAQLNSLTAKSVPAWTKLVFFGRYVLNIYVGIVQYFLRKTKTRRAKIYLPTQRTNRRISYDIN